MSFETPKSRWSPDFLAVALALLLAVAVRLGLIQSVPW